MWKLQPQQDTVENWAYIEQAFTKEQCQEIIRLGELLLPTTAHTAGNVNPCLEIRDSKVSWMHPNNETAPIFQKLTEYVIYLNNKFFNFDIDGFSEGLQFTKYEPPAGKYEPHLDKIFNGTIRKLSVVVQLSDPADYEGGDLILKLGHEDTSVPKQQGRLTVFPSYVLHGVQPVTAGTRYSLVAWITGPRFK